MTARPPVNSPARPQTASGRGAGRSDLRPRIVSALVLVAMAFATLWAGGQVFVLFWLLASLAVLWEWQRLISAPGYLTRLFAGASGLAICAALASSGLGDWAIGMSSFSRFWKPFFSRHGEAEVEAERALPRLASGPRTWFWLGLPKAVA